MDRLQLTSSIFIAVASGFSVGAPAAAQYESSPGPLSLDVSIGYGVGSTDGTYLGNTSGFAAGIIGAFRVRPLVGGGLVVALDAGVQGGGSYEAVCLPNPSGECLRPFPQFAVFSAQAGWETSGGMVRMLAGPAVAHADANAVALSGRIDLSRPLLGPIWFVASGHGTFVPDHRGDSFTIVNLSVGARIR